VDKELLRKHSEGLICLSPAEVRSTIRSSIAGRKRPRPRRASFPGDLGEGNFYLEMQDHGIPEQRLANEVLRRISARTGIPLVVSNDSIPEEDDAFARRPALHRHPEDVADTDRLEIRLGHFYMKSRPRCTNLPDDHAEIEKTLAIAERCNLVIRPARSTSRVPRPAGETLDGYFEKGGAGGLDERLAEIRKRRAQGLVKSPDSLYPPAPGVRVGHQEDGLPGATFLVVWDFIRYSREHGTSRSAGARSAAGSVVSYALRITDIDPCSKTSSRALPEPERIRCPTFDIDFCMPQKGRGHPLRRREVRRDRGPDHHLRDAAPQSGDPGRRPGMGPLTPRSTASPSSSPT